MNIRAKRTLPHAGALVFPANHPTHIIHFITLLYICIKIRYMRGAPKGNQFWKLRSKHGRDRIFATPEIMWEAACEYFEWCDKNPFQAVEVSAGCKVTVPKMRPYTLSGLSIYLDVWTSYFDEFSKTCSKEFSEVISRIREVIYSQKFSGAASGFFNANIIARDLGLADKREEQTTALITTDPGMLDAIAQKLNNNSK
jgi:DNA-packaging protein gp3